MLMDPSAVCTVDVIDFFKQDEIIYGDKMIMERIKKTGRFGIVLTLSAALLAGSVSAWGCSGQSDSGDPETTGTTTAEVTTTAQTASVTTSSSETSAAVTESTGTSKSTETAASDSSDGKTDRLIAEKLSDMSIEEKLAQMFAVMPEAISDASPVTDGYELKDGLYEYPLGGILLMGQNIVSEDQTRSLIRDIQSYSEDRIGVPLFTFVDEEGGPVRRVSGRIDGIPYLKSAQEMTEDGDDIYTVGKTVGAYLSDMGFNVDFAPVADVVSESSAGVINGRSFSSDPQVVAKAVTDFAKGLESEKVYGTFKHFPGHGPTRSDTHNGSAYVDKTIDELESWDLVPFQAAIDSGAKFIMISHHTVNSIDPEGTPATLSKAVITDLLKNKMGYDGIVVTDALNMGAITDHYSPAEAALMAVKAGADIILEPSDFTSAYDAVLNAVESGEISEARIDESVGKILELKSSF